MPAVVCGLCEGFDFAWCDVFSCGDVSAGSSWINRNHHEMLLEESHCHLIGGGLYLLGPEVVVVIVAGEAGDADSD